MSDADILAAPALGADFTLIGPAYLYGLMSGVRPGVVRALGILVTDMPRLMAAYFASIGTKTGLYSMSSQWSQIVGTTPTTSPLYTAKSWLAGASSLTSAKRLCAAAPLTGGGKVALIQYVSGGFDYDYSCP